MEKDVALPEKTPLVQRSEVTKESDYKNYKEVLRTDFIYSCGYCTLAESEALAINFEIDHYEPVSRRPDLQNEYSNLMYSCKHCNNLKLDLTPPDEAREKGHRFFRPDNDCFTDHFAIEDVRLSGKTTVGCFSVDYLDLNRTALKKVREIRNRLANCQEFVAYGVHGLRHYKIDRLPPQVRARAVALGKRAEILQGQLEDEIDTVLSAFAASPLADPDPDKISSGLERSAKLAKLRGAFPGIWRGRELTISKKPE